LHDCAQLYLCYTQDGAAASEAIVLRAENDVAYTNEPQGIGAHDAGLDGHIQRGAMQLAPRRFSVAVQRLDTLVKGHELWEMQALPGCMLETAGKRRKETGDWGKKQR
jgi:hypothetical protein